MFHKFQFHQGRVQEKDPTVYPLNIILKLLFLSRDFNTGFPGVPIISSRNKRVVCQWWCALTVIS